MIDLYTWKTPNGWKVSIMLEETKLDYQVKPVDISKNEQLSPEYLAINPNNKIPAIVDHNGPENKPFTLFESGAILVYLAEKTGKLIGSSARQKFQVLQWLMFQMGGFGPMLGQANHFLRFASEKIPYAIERFGQEAKRLYAVLDKQLQTAEYLAADYSIADIACFPWVLKHEFHGIHLEDYPNVQRWFAAINQRPAVQKGLQIIR